ncbi:MAG: TIGR04255 family protein [Verrucomicrobia bacterium]|nr:TIGR04255 family protein [Verrucomicrobiota bacterium]
MDEIDFQLPNAPIIEAVLDIDCDLPPALDLSSLQADAADALRERYPKFRRHFIHEQVVTKEADRPPELRVNEGLGALQFLTEDEKQLVQFRPNGFSFNRLAPYGSLDDYLPEIEASWRTFLTIAKPVLVRKVGIRMINRILLPMQGGKLDFGEFLQVPPRLPTTGEKLVLLGFLDQHLAIDAETGNRVNIVKTTQLPEDDKLPLILDIDTFQPCHVAPEAWGDLLAKIKSLRTLKNRIFRHTLTPRCLNLFSPSA